MFQTYDFKIATAGDPRSVSLDGDFVEVVKATGNITFQFSPGFNCVARQGDMLKSDVMQEYQGFSFFSDVNNDVIQLRAGRGWTFRSQNVALAIPNPLPVSIATDPVPALLKAYHTESGINQTLETGDKGNSLLVTNPKYVDGFVHSAPETINVRSTPGLKIEIQASPVGSSANFGVPVFDQWGNYYSSGEIPILGNLGKSFYLYCEANVTLTVTATAGTLAYNVYRMSNWILPNANDFVYQRALYNGPLNIGAVVNLIPAVVGQKVRVYGVDLSFNALCNLTFYNSGTVVSPYTSFYGPSTYGSPYNIQAPKGRFLFETANDKGLDFITVAVATVGGIGVGYSYVPNP